MPYLFLVSHPETEVYDNELIVDGGLEAPRRRAVHLMQHATNQDSIITGTCAPSARERVRVSYRYVTPRRVLYDPTLQYT